MTAKVTEWDASEYLETEEDISQYLTASMEEGGVPLLRAAHGDVVKAHGTNETLGEKDFANRLAEAEEAIAQGLVHSASEIFDELRKRHSDA